MWVSWILSCISVSFTPTRGALPTNSLLWDESNLIFGLWTTGERHAHLPVGPEFLERLLGLMKNNYFTAFLTVYYDILLQLPILLKFYYNYKFDNTNISIMKSMVNNESNLIN